MVRVEIVQQAIEVDRELGFATGDCGAVVEFQGIVRGTEAGVPIAAIDYECHIEMAKAQLRRIAEEVATFYTVAEFVVLHRIGTVAVGETSLYIRSVAPHRREAFAAAMELIERLKKDVPIWKHPKGSA
jgi:molybdopterin synthase catalytic subunit